MLSLRLCILFFLFFRTCSRRHLSNPVCLLSILSFHLLIRLIGTEVVNSLNRQRNALEVFLKACIGLEGNPDLLLETRIW